MCGYEEINAFHDTLTLWRAKEKEAPRKRVSSAHLGMAVSECVDKSTKSFPFKKTRGKENK